MRTLEGIYMREMPLFNDLWDYNNPAETEQRFLALLPQAEAGDDLSLHIQLLTQLGRTQGLQDKFDEAHVTLAKAQALLTLNLHIPLVRYLLERGRVYNSSGNKALARPLFLEAWQIAQAHADAEYYAVDAAHMMGIVEPVDEQLSWHLKALALAKKSSNAFVRKWLGPLYNNIGWTYHDLGEYEQALTIFEQSWAWRQQESQNDPRTIRIAKWCVARTLRSLGRVTEALSMQEELLDAWEQAGEQGAYVYEEMAECLWLLGRLNEARPYFGLAYDLLSQDQWLVKHESARLERLREKASVT